MNRVTIGSLSVLLALAGAAHAQEIDLPTPYELVSQTDFECRTAQGNPPAPQVLVRQLNPVLEDKIPNLQTPLGPLEEVCVPVAKNGQVPSPAALAFIRWFDLACYRATGPWLGVDLVLSHLNPVLSWLPDEDITLGRLEQVCLPVIKNNVEPPAPYKRMASHFDLGCYSIEPTAAHDVTLLLTHLNPVIRQLGLPDRVVDVHRAHQLCVPIGKNNQPIPPGILAFIEWADFLKYRVEPRDPIPPLPLWLEHINPIYDAVPRFLTTLLADRVRLMVPVAKDHHLPPGGQD